MRKQQRKLKAHACAHARQVWPAADGLISLAFGAVVGLPELAALAIHQDDGASFPDALPLPLADGGAAPQDWLAAAPVGPLPAASAPAPPDAPAAGPAAAAAEPGAALGAPAAGPTVAAAPVAASGSALGASPPLAATLPAGSAAAGLASGQPLAEMRGDGDASAPAFQNSTAAGPASVPDASQQAAAVAAPALTEFYSDPALSALPALLAAQLPPGGLAAPLDISADPGGGRRGGRAARAPGDALFTWLAVFATLPGTRPAAGHFPTAPPGAQPATTASSHACGCHSVSAKSAMFVVCSTGSG